MTDQQFNNLPKFAKKEIERLRVLLKDATDEIAAVVDKRETRIRWGYDSLGTTYGFINEIKTIFFRIGEGTRGNFIRVRLKEGGECLNINADRPVSIEPYTTNDFHVRLNP